MLTQSMLNQDLPHFENSEGPDQLASEKPADQGPHCFPLRLYGHANNLNLATLLIHSIKHEHPYHVRSSVYSIIGNIFSCYTGPVSILIYFKVCYG